MKELLGDLESQANPKWGEKSISRHNTIKLQNNKEDLKSSLRDNAAAAAAKSLQSCLTLCNPTDGSPPGSPVPGILQARTLEWVAISFSNAWKWKVKVKSLSRVRPLATPWTAAYQAPLSMGVSRQEYWSGVPLPSPDYLQEKDWDELLNSSDGNQETVKYKQQCTQRNGGSRQGWRMEHKCLSGMREDKDVFKWNPQ